MKQKTCETQLNCLLVDINITIYDALNLSKICLDIPNFPQIWLFLLVFGRNFHHISKLAQFFELS